MLPLPTDFNRVKKTVASGRPTAAGNETSTLPVAGSSVLFTSVDGTIAVRVGSGAGGAVITGGYARYEKIERDGEKDILEFVGLELYEQKIPILFDGWRGDPDRESVEGDIRLLERLAVVPAGATRPPLVRVAGNARRTDLTWVIQGPIEWAAGPDMTELITDGVTGVRYRQAGVVTLVENEDDELLTEKDARPRDKQGRTLQPTRVKAGEKTFRDVAKRVYGTRNRAKDIAKANDLPLSTRLVEHQLLYLPAS